MRIVHIVLPYEQATALAEQVLGLFLEYRTLGHPDHLAHAYAVLEFAEGMSVDPATILEARSVAPPADRAEEVPLW